MTWLSVRWRQPWWMLGVSLAVLFTIWSLLGLIADVSAFRAKAWVDTWIHQAIRAQSKGELFQPLPEDWQQAQRLAELSITLAPFNAEYREVLGRVHEARFIMAPLGDSGARPDRERAAALYRQSIKLRPTWPYPHAGLAYALYRAGGHDAEVERALAEAARLGPWEPAVMEAILDIGFDGWYLLTPAARQMVMATATRSQSWRAGRAGEGHADRAWAIVARHRKQALVCSLLPLREERNRQRCNPAGWGN